MLVEIVVEVGHQEVGHLLYDGGAVGPLMLVLPHVFGAELHLGLRLEFGLLDADAHRPDYALAYVCGVEVLLEEVLEDLGHHLLECREVGAAEGGVLPVHERPDVLAVSAAVGEGHLYVVAPEVDGFVEGFLLHALVEEVEEAVGRFVFGAVEDELQPHVEVGVVAEHRLDIVEIVFVGFEQALVGDERDECTVLLRGGLRGEARGEESPLFVFEAHGLPVAERLHAERRRKGVHRLETHAVHADRLLEVLVVELGPGVELAHRCVEYVLPLVVESEGDAAAVVAYGDALPVDVYLDALAEAHRKLVYGVVDDLLHHDVHAVVGGGSVAETAYVHTGPEPDMLQIFEGDDAAAVVALLPLLRCGFKYALFLFHFAICINRRWCSGLSSTVPRFCRIS